MKTVCELAGAALGGLVIFLAAMLWVEARADHLGEAIPEGGCVLCWGGPDGDTQIGYSRSGHCKRGEAGVVEPYAAGCQGPDLTAGHPVLEGVARWLVPEARADTGPVCGLARDGQ